MDHELNRRQFLKGATGFSLAVVGSGLSGILADGKAPAIQTVKNPNAKLQLAVVGLGGISSGHLRTVAKDEALVALCECEPSTMKHKFEWIQKLAHHNVKPEDMRQFADYREMLADMGDKLDGVMVCTPDHNHAIIALDAMKQGKHAFVEKPMAHNIQEALTLRQAYHHYGVATQQGNERHSSSGIRSRVQLIRAGAIGPVHEVYYWCARSIGGSDKDVSVSTADKLSQARWLWSVPVPLDIARAQYKQIKDTDPMDKWEFGWRGDRRYGTGSLGDWGAHLIDDVYWALRFDQASSWKVESVFRKHGGPHHYYKTNIIKWTIPERAGMPPVTAYWYDGRIPNDDPDLKDDEGKPLAAVWHIPPKLKELMKTHNRRFDPFGALYIGEKGCMVNGQLVPRDLYTSAKELKIERIQPAKGGNDQEWFHAIRTGEPSSCNFDYSAGMVEHMLCGLLSDHVPVGEVVEYDAVNHKVVSHPELNRYISRTYRQGYEVVI